jgi:hypothetical protein
VSGNFTPPMKNLTPKITLIASMLAVAGLFAVPAVRAADEKGDATSKAEKKAKRDAENLAKYDKNKNGKLDEDELAALKADEEKMKAEKKAKKEKKDKEKTN